MKARILCAIICVGAVGGSMPVRAQGSNFGTVAPKGSYLKSCNNIGMSGTVLTATCNGGANGKPYRNSIDTSWCAGDIWNEFGSLRCNANKPWGAGRALPTGSYLASCSWPWVKGFTLSAYCRPKHGSLRNTSLTLSACHWGKGIDNIDGQLICH